MTMTDITIPPDARKAAWEAFVDASMNEKLSSEECVDAACIAMLKAWPGMKRSRLGSDGDLRIILPPHTGEHQ